MSVLVSVVIPTFRRNESLTRALKSCVSARGRDDVEVVVVDNSPDAAGRATVEAFRAQASLAVRYVHEPTPGVSHARNRGVREARGDYVVFLDDDEEAEPEWLDALLHARARFDADAVFGAVLAVTEGAARAEVDFILATFTRDFAMKSGVVPRSLLAFLGTGNSLFRRSLLLEVPFNTALSLIGGEDVTLIRSLVDRGARVAWCKEARVKEFLPSARSNVRYYWRYRFSAGQVRTVTCLVKERPSRAEAGLWMAVGLAQVMIYGGLAAATATFERRASARFLGRAFGGAGKVLWPEPFWLKRYART